MKHISVPSPIYQNVINLTWRLPLKKIESLPYLLMLRCAKQLFTISFFYVAGFNTIQTQLRLEFSFKLLFPIVHSKMRSFQNFALIYPEEFSCGT
jgi:hypothetical protein